MLMSGNDRLLNMDSETKTIDVIGIIELLTNDVLDNEKWLLVHLEQSIKTIREKA